MLIMRSSPDGRIVIAVLLVLALFESATRAESTAIAPQATGAVSTLANRLFATDAVYFSSLPTDAAHAAYARITSAARLCRSGTAGDRAGCTIHAMFEVDPIAPAAEPSSPEESTMTFALAETRGSCAALAAIALAVAQDAGVKLEAWVHGEHVLVAVPRGDGYFELLEGGRLKPWPRTSAPSPSIDERGTRVSATDYLGYYLDNLAVRLASAGDARRAEHAFGQAIAATPKAARLRFNYGTFLLNGKRVKEAATQLRRAVRLDDRNADAWTNLGVAYAQSGSASQARRSFEHALRIDPRNTNARRNLEGISSGVAACSAPSPR
jgi:tetratricopeptide (TPR) repeat protein